MWEATEWVLATALNHTGVTMRIQFYKIVFFKARVLVPMGTSIGNGTMHKQRWEPTWIPRVLRCHHFKKPAIKPPASDFSKGFPVPHLMGYCLHLLTVRNLDFMWTWDTSKSYKCANYQPVRTLANKYHHQLQNWTNAITLPSILLLHHYCYATLQKLQNFHFLPMSKMSGLGSY